MAQKSFLQPWPDISGDISIETVYQQAHKRATELFDPWVSLLTPFVPADCQLLPNIKGLESFSQKAKRKPVRKIHDVLRAGILTNSMDEVEPIAKRIEARLDVVESDYKDDPDRYETGYYGSVHLKVRFHDLICEIQIMPQTVWTYKERTHSFYASHTHDRSILGFCRWLYKTANQESA
jgi:hypothetical protein